jgi:hypothetical protein
MIRLERRSAIRINTSSVHDAVEHFVARAVRNQRHLRASCDAADWHHRRRVTLYLLELDVSIGGLEEAALRRLFTVYLKPAAPASWWHDC